jgi:hypothetical protein
MCLSYLESQRKIILKVKGKTDVIYEELLVLKGACAFLSPLEKSAGLKCR